jgi:hypothetical protein
MFCGPPADRRYEGRRTAEGMTAVNAVQERQQIDHRTMAYLTECAPEDLLEFEPRAVPRYTFPTMLVVTLAIVVLVSTASAILLLLRV